MRKKKSDSDEPEVEGQENGQEAEAPDLEDRVTELERQMAELRAHFRMG